MVSSRADEARCSDMAAVEMSSAVAAVAAGMFRLETPETGLLGAAAGRNLHGTW